MDSDSYTNKERIQRQEFEEQITCELEQVDQVFLDMLCLLSQGPIKAVV